MLFLFEKKSFRYNNTLILIILPFREEKGNNHDYSQELMEV